MATNYSANQYEKAFSPKYLQNWSPAKPTKEVLHVLLRSQYLILPTISVTHWHLISLASSKFPYPSLPQPLAQIPWTPILSFLFHFSQALLSSPPPQRISSQEGYTQIIANDRGHLLPSVPRSKESPWGSFMGTWQMPLKVPPARVTLTSRSVAGAASLTKWIQKNPDLLKASNGLRPEIFGKESWSLREDRGSSKNTTSGARQLTSAGACWEEVPERAHDGSWKWLQDILTVCPVLYTALYCSGAGWSWSWQPSEESPI
ncbi:protein Flattop isoform X1 [Canis aureus]